MTTTDLVLVWIGLIFWAVCLVVATVPRWFTAKFYAVRYRARRARNRNLLQENKNAPQK